MKIDLKAFIVVSKSIIEGGPVRQELVLAIDLPEAMAQWELYGYDSERRKITAVSEFEVDRVIIASQS